MQDRLILDQIGLLRQNLLELSAKLGQSIGQIDGLADHISQNGNRPDRSPSGLSDQSSQLRCRYKDCEKIIDGTGKSSHVSHLRYQHERSIHGSVWTKSAEALAGTAGTETTDGGHAKKYPCRYGCGNRRGTPGSREEHERRKHGSIWKPKNK